MKGCMFLALIGGLLVASPAGPPLAAQGPVFRSATGTVPVYVTVIGRDGRLVTDLEREHFVVRDNGRPQPIAIFDAGLQPITISVMLDTSGSMVGNLPVLRSAAVQLFTRLTPDDRASVGHFGDRIVIGREFTNDVDTLIRALWLDMTPGGPTPLWGGVMAAMASMSDFEGRRVVLVFSDGHNTGLRRYGPPSGPNLEDVIARAQTGNYMVYAIGMRSRSRGGRSGGGGFGGARGVNRSEPDPGLAELAAESGGGYFELDDASELGPTFARVADELHYQYVLGFDAPDADGQVHQLEVEVGVAGLRPRARRTYRAPAAGVP